MKNSQHALAMVIGHDTDTVQPLSKRQKFGFQDILQYFGPSLSYHLSLRSLF